MTGPRLGVIADDLTGACDLADAVRDAGGRAVVMLGVPEPGLRLPPCDCAVVALRTRTAPADIAVAESVAAARHLLAAGAGTLYQKYCSTFDSTDDGTIGPVADALRTLVGDGSPAPSIGTPATPRAGRTQYQGHLFVGDRLLSESPLRHHPLTPMHDPDLIRVLGRQTAHPVALLPWAVLHTADPARALADLLDTGAAHVLADALTDDDLDRLAAALPTDRPVLLGGAAGFAAALARRWTPDRTNEPPTHAADPGTSRALIISGSCSARTREQIAHFDGPRLDLDAVALAEGRLTVDDLVDRLADHYRHGTGPVLVSSSADPDTVRGTQDRLGRDRAAQLLERAAGQLAARAVQDLGVRRLLVAGGETSGAVVGALGLGVLQVGPAAAPGVPWMIPAEGPPIRLLLKSGNFGDPELFRTAWEVCP
ncbi:3-oxo-tetronate kinase [Cellulomonas denverensis]|uniref:3-oxo-tetronate kinase n=1 Tax=Cellulomonas denverensis TaxID=264297 RepID=A0A7X6KVQ8_9CELL|nr:3-oxo-tetronate kinase [Cellulomonas denverensis]NKY23187.1 four-carbon acid sugar kinase family protein [Cellulomonas denverensis]GIG26699.1 HPr kinase [Cellulomonas denverensis]